MNEIITKVLSHYGLYAYEVEQHTARVFKVYTNHGAVAVKHTSLKEEQLNAWLEAYKKADTYRFKSIIPLYVTSNHQFFVSVEEGLFYVMPWIEERQRDTPTYMFESLYSTLGAIHSRTSKTEVVNKERFEPFIEQHKKRIRSWKDTLERAVEKFEKRHYMPPIELQICTHFRDLIQVFGISEEWGDRFLEDMEEDKKIRHSLCHGNMKPSHFIYDDNQPYLINWERASINHPVYDLTEYFWHVIRFHDAPVEQLISTFDSYEEKHSLLNSERSLFAIYLLNPDPYMEQVESYVNGARSTGQPFQVQKLERTYFVLQHALLVQEKLQQARIYVQEQQLEEADTSEDTES